MAYTFPGQIDPGMFIGLQSMDFGEMTSPDGRSHSVDAYTPVQVVDASSVTTGVVTPPTMVDAVGNPITDLAKKLAEKAVPSHWMARGVFILIGVALVIIVAARLTLTE
jgi:hypothetical protein